MQISKMLVIWLGTKLQKAFIFHYSDQASDITAEVESCSTPSKLI